MKNNEATPTIETLEARYDETSEALRAAAPSERAEALAKFEKAIEDLRTARAAAANW